MPVPHRNRDDVAGFDGGEHGAAIGLVADVVGEYQSVRLDLVVAPLGLLSPGSARMPAGARSRTVLWICVALAAAAASTATAAKVRGADCAGYLIRSFDTSRRSPVKNG
jgi:hypothetical protein